MKTKLNLNNSLFGAIIGLLFSLLLSNIAYAVTSEDAGDLVQTTTNRMLDALQQRRAEIEANPQVIYDITNEIAVPHFDFERITQDAMGKNWRKATTEQRQALITEFQNLLVRTYGKALRNYSGQEITLSQVQPGKKSNLVKVSTKVSMPGASPVPINYLLHVKGNAWKVYDVVIDGVSLVINYRRSFAQEIHKGGIDGLIQNLQSRNETGPT